jgi:hypothetical protein
METVKTEPNVRDVSGKTIVAVLICTSEVLAVDLGLFAEFLYLGPSRQLHNEN